MLQDFENFSNEADRARGEPCVARALAETAAPLRAEETSSPPPTLCFHVCSPSLPLNPPTTPVKPFQSFKKPSKPSSPPKTPAGSTTPWKRSARPSGRRPPPTSTPPPPPRTASPPPALSATCVLILLLLRARRNFLNLCGWGRATAAARALAHARAAHLRPSRPSSAPRRPQVGIGETCDLCECECVPLQPPLPPRSPSSAPAARARIASRLLFLQCFLRRTAAHARVPGRSTIPMRHRRLDRLCAQPLRLRQGGQGRGVRAERAGHEAHRQAPPPPRAQADDGAQEPPGAVRRARAPAAPRNPQILYSSSKPPQLSKTLKPFESSGNPTP